MVRGVPQTPKTTQAINIAVGYPLELYGEILSIRTSYTSSKRYRKVNLVLTWKLPPCRLAFMEPEGTWKAGGEEKPPEIVPAVTYSVSYSNNWPEKIHQLVQYRPGYYGSD